MTKDEIKKTLKTCNPTYYNCKICPYKSVERCVDTMNNDALNLITEQEKEIEQLKDDYAKLQELFAHYQMASDKEIRAQIKQAKIDMLNELKAKAFDKDAFNGWAGSTFVVLVRDIDKMIEELTKCQK